MNKKNLSLLGLLILALVLTYFFEERSNITSEKERMIASTLLSSDSLGDLQSLKGVKLDFYKKEGVFFDHSTNLKLSEARLNEFFQLLSNLKVTSTINKAEVTKVGLPFYIPDQEVKLHFTFSRGEMIFTLGKKLDYDQSFYMQVEKNGQSEVVIVRDDSPDPGAYANEEQYKKSDAKYRRIQVVFLLTNKYFEDTRVFQDFNYKPDTINFESMSIATFRNKRFSISFASSTTTPPVPNGLSYFDDNWVSFLNVMTKLEGKSLLFPSDPKLLDEVLSQIDVVDREKRKYSLELYKKYGEDKGYFLKTSFNKIIYVIKPQDAEYFFVNIQDFWQKRFAPKEKEFDLSLTFFNGKKLEVKVLDQELFKVLPGNSQKVKEADLRPLEFKRIIELLKSEGNHVSEMTEKPTEILKKNILRVQFENRSLNVILEDNEVVLVDIEKKLKIHHYVGAKIPFSVSLSDYYKGQGL